MGPTVNVAFHPTRPCQARIKVWNTGAQLVSEWQETRPSGPQSCGLDAQSYANGVYYYRVEMDYVGGGSERLKVRKFVVRRR